MTDGRMKYERWVVGAAPRKWTADCDEVPGGTISQPVSSPNRQDPVCLVVSALNVWKAEEKIDMFARLIADAPATSLCLDLVSAGLARIERSETWSITEFCFNGIRYDVSGGWSSVVDLIGWDRARAALAMARGLSDD